MEARHRLLIGQIESLIHRDVGRGMQAVFRAARGGLWGAASALAAQRAPRIGLLTGFFVPGGDPPAAETDGPAAAALMARAFINAGLHCRVATDTSCKSATRAALEQAGVACVPIDTVAPGATAPDAVAQMIDRWRQDGIDQIIAIERCGPAADGRPRNMRGTDISAHAAPLDELFAAGPWGTIAIGDGGNELGMGVIPRSLIAGHVLMGDRIGCVVPADHLIVAGISHWGAYAMLAALSLLRLDWSQAMRACLDPSLDKAIVEAMVRDGPAVDGVSLLRAATIDAFDLEVHHKMLTSIKVLAEQRGWVGQRAGA